jgi:hypothetical protein
MLPTRLGQPAAAPSAHRRHDRISTTGKATEGGADSGVRSGASADGRTHHGSPLPISHPTNRERGGSLPVMGRSSGGAGRGEGPGGALRGRGGSPLLMGRCSPRGAASRSSSPPGKAGELPAPPPDVEVAQPERHQDEQIEQHVEEKAHWARDSPCIIRLWRHDWAASSGGPRSEEINCWIGALPRTRSRSHRERPSGAG